MGRQAFNNYYNNNEEYSRKIPSWDEIVGKAAKRSKKEKPESEESKQERYKKAGLKSYHDWKPVKEYFDYALNGNFSESTTNEEIMKAVYDLIELRDAVVEAVALPKASQVAGKVGRGLLGFAATVAKATPPGFTTS